MSEFESPKLKIAGNVQFFKANAEFSVAAHNKSIQRQRREVVNLGDSIYWIKKERRK